MLKKRIIPCLDIKDGRTVKGTNFIQLKDAGDPVELARKYAADGADELVLLDITATVEGRGTLVTLVTQVAQAINIPFTVGGGIRTVDDAAVLLRAGADKVSVNSAAFRNRQLIRDIAYRFGRQCVVVAIDAKRVDGNWHVHTNGGRVDTGVDVLMWAKDAVACGAGELLLTSMDNDGVQQGFAMELTDAVCDAVSVPVIASGGAGNAQHFAQLFTHTQAAAALAAGIFHYGQLGIGELKNYLRNKEIQVR